MENDVAFYAASYVLARLAVVAGFAYLFYRALRPARAFAFVRAEDQWPRAANRADRVPEDRC